MDLSQFNLRERLTKLRGRVNMLVNEEENIANRPYYRSQQAELIAINKRIDNLQDEIFDIEDKICEAIPESSSVSHEYYFDR